MATIMDLRPNKGLVAIEGEAAKGAQVANVSVVNAGIEFSGRALAEQAANALIYVSPNLAARTNNDPHNIANVFASKDAFLVAMVNKSEPVAPSANISANTKNTDNGMTV